MSDFIFNNGSKARTLPEFLSCLKETDDATFSHHVNENKNDFSNWVRDVIGNKKLAGDISSLKTKQQIISKIESETNCEKNALRHFAKSHKEALSAFSTVSNVILKKLKEGLEK